ncbi:ELMO domain-containing protein 3-like isoform X1 [Strongylocentrotus purpuratus]|uniref:ELMO domain-containing protein n=1 Tax=Strongylocentrotus purpuratus TaxID=7668 RepID=A0A7M7NWS1_STRPU|nr:ELMO domain-containing protein 3-like isoform X1 [Strongylocentrotus purpuratus]
MATSTFSMDNSSNLTPPAIHITEPPEDKEEDDDDDFNDIIAEDDTPAAKGDNSACEAVNYKVSMDEFQNVDVFKSPSAPTTAPEPTPPSTRGSGDEADGPVEQETAKVEEPIPEEPTKTDQSQPSDESSLTHNQAVEKDDKTGDPVLVNGSSKANGDSGNNGVTAPSTEDILKAEVSRTGVVEPSEQLLRAQAEWDAVETIQPGAASPGKHSAVRKQALVSFNEALGFFQTCNMEKYMSKIKPCVQRTGFAALKHLVLGPPKMNKGLLDERNLVFAIAQYPFDDDELIHKRVLQTVYKQLTGSAIDCPRFGSHWEQIGFQGTDPSTDLRACGFLGLLTLLDFLMDSQKFPLAKEIYKLSQHETQNFPFCVMAINMTRIALQALREEHLSRECNRRKQVFGVINDFYASIFLQLYQTWKQQRKTIHDSGFVLKELEANCKKNPRTMMRNLEIYLAERSSRGGDMSPRSGAASSPGKEKTIMDFAGVHELEDQQG